MNNKEKGRIIERLHSHFKNFGKSFGCLNPLCTSSETIGSHSVSEKFLREIQEDGHLWRFASDKSKNIYKKGKDLIPLSKASKFRGFCKDCDNKLFEPFETFDLQLTKEHLSLLAFRSVAKEYHSKIGVVDLYTNEFSEVSKGNIGTQLEMLRAEKFSQLFQRSVKVITERDFEEFDHHVYIFDTPTFLMASSIAMPDVLPSNKRIKIKVWEPFAINWIPLKNQCACVISINPLFKKKPKKFVDAFNKLNEKHTALALLIMTIDNCENIFFRPSFRRSLSDSEFEYLSKIFYGFEDPFSFVEYPHFDRFNLLKNLPKLKEKKNI